MMMKLVLILGVFSGSEVLANDSQNHFLFGLVSGPGYVAPEYQYEKTCTISKDGVRIYTYKDARQHISRNEKTLSAKTMQDLNETLIQAQNCVQVTSHYATYGGDAPGYQFIADTAFSGSELSDEIHGATGFKIHVDGTTILPACKPAQTLLNKVSAVCGMSAEIKHMQALESAAKSIF